ncbi:MAG: MmcQ/YjbR family DNA-binding protein [Muribaculaceae bacterium]|nr:MmcQ/YjbR family DNA-binding protein [Muribaculaceae bacterium]
MNIEEVREYGLSLPHATERMPFGPDTYCLEIGGRMFCLMTLDGEWDFYNLKVDPDYSEELRATYHDIIPGYHMNKRHWISVKFKGEVPDSLQRELILHSYRQAGKNLPKRVRIELGLI